MNVLFDTLASPEDSGGMRLHAREVINSWIEEYPRDRVVVIGPRWVKLDIPAHSQVRYIIWPNENAILRIVGEMIIVPLIAWTYLRSSVLLSLSPVLSPLSPRSRSYIVSHDWRHLYNPHQFSAMQRIYRSIWARSLRWAKAVFAISTKTANEIHLIEPRTPVIVVPNGRDHARRWAPVQSGDRLAADDPPIIVTFGHKNHKRPELAIGALKTLQHDAKLVVLGATGEYRNHLVNLAQEAGVAGQCEFPGFVDEITYQRTASTATIVLLLATDDGFGLPVAEAEYFGIHSIVTSDGGLAAIHPNAVEVEPNVQDLAQAIDTLLNTPGRQPTAPKWTWRNTIVDMRAVVLSHNTVYQRQPD